MLFSMRSSSPRSIICLNYVILVVYLLKCVFVFTKNTSMLMPGDNCIEEGDPFTDNGNSTTLVSPGNLFEFGFFTPDRNPNKYRYLGIWYYNESNPKIVVWIANRDNPLLKSNGYLIVQGHNAELFDSNNKSHWSTDAPKNISNLQNEVLHISIDQKSNSSPVTYRHVPPPSGRPVIVARQRSLCLGGDGNLILYDRRDANPKVWQSFLQPTDTYLPGMPTDEGLILTSWLSSNNPTAGNFKVLVQPGAANEFDISEKGDKNYWKSGPVMSELLGPSHKYSFCNTTRTVMNFTGHFQLWERVCGKGWSLMLSEPKDVCNYYNKCGTFGSCNSYNGISCKCLPGFRPSVKTNSGDSSGGCSPISGPPSDRNDSSDDIFLSLPMMKVANQYCSISSMPSKELCADQCLADSNCFAFYYGFTDCQGNKTNVKKCLTWLELFDLQEEYTRGFTLSLRTTKSDIKPTTKDCEPCGTYIVPYPLSTGANCGDPTYFNFRCNGKTGQVNFSSPHGSFRVTLIDPDRKRFHIQVQNASSCDKRFLDSLVFSPKISLPFNVTNCSVVKDQPLIDVDQPYIEVEMGWQPPPEIACKTDSDCHHWLHTSCKPKGGNTRCICGSKFRWDGLSLMCTREPFPTKFLVSCISGGLAFIIFCTICSLYLFWKRRIMQRRDSVEYKADDTEGIDVPFFDWGSIVAATSNFADANKLGKGGFGSVHRGTLPDGKEVAVKRLSTVSVQGVEEFRTEVMLIAKLQHRNLVRLLGYCVKADEKILVYEYMPNGSLDSCLFDENSPAHLDWKKRFDIIFGIARGLLYLHQDSRLRIIHRDLKPSNILLDEDLNPKISDFGIARIIGGKDTESSTKRVVGTYGYMSPEYAYEGVFSVKSDVFSFGVVVLETLSGRRNSRIFVFEHGMSLLGHAWRLWSEDRVLELVDQTLKESCKKFEVLKCIHIGLLCVQEDPNDRPTMSAVVLMLSSENASFPAPKQPAFSSRKPPLEAGSSSSAADSTIPDITASTVGR